MAYVTYRSTSSLPITYQWKCSQCGALNRKNTTVKTYGESVSMGKRPNSNSQWQASAIAEGQMYAGLDILFGKRGSFNDFRNLGLNYPCEKCRHKEPWAAKNRYKLGNFINKAGITILLWDGLALLLTLFTGGWSAFLVCLIIAGILVGGQFLFTYLDGEYESKKDKEIRSLPFTSLPIMVIDDEPVIDIYSTDTHGQENTELTEKETTKSAKQKIDETNITSSNLIPKTQKTEINDIRFCKKCGKRIPENSLFCQYCGDRIILPDEISPAGQKPKEENNRNAGDPKKGASITSPLENELLQIKRLYDTHQLSKEEFDILQRITKEKYTTHINL